MPSSNLALLIASTYRGLLGPLNDVETLERVLSKQGFAVTKCCGQAATRQGILDAWAAIIDKVRPGDCLVVFYAGHGGLAEPTKNNPGRRRYQFLYPADYVHEPGEFRGILDIELSHWMRISTAITQNVTFILDCCHAGRMARDPAYGDRAVARQQQLVRRNDIAPFIDSLRATGQLSAEIGTEGVPNAVRLAASSTSESAFELDGRGVMTQALAMVLEEAQDRDMSWRASILRIRDLVHAHFPTQNPQVEGPDRRFHFSLEEGLAGVLIRREQGGLVLHAGKAGGVETGDVYDVMSHGAERVAEKSYLGKAMVIQVTAFRADVRMLSSDRELPPDGALGFLHHKALTRLPVRIAEGLEILRAKISKSRYLRAVSAEDNSMVAFEFTRNKELATLRIDSGFEIASRSLSDIARSVTAVNELVGAAEQHARSQALLSLKPTSQETLEHGIDVTFRRVSQGFAGEIISTSGGANLAAGDPICVILRNTGPTVAHVSIFNVNVAGKIALCNTSWPRGIEIEPGRHYIWGKNQFDDQLPGRKFSWPKTVPREGSVPERFVMIVTGSAVDLGCLTNPEFTTLRGDASSLEKLMFQIATGIGRDIEDDGAERPLMKFQTIHVPLSLHAVKPLKREASLARSTITPEQEGATIAAADLPAPESLGDLAEFQSIESLGHTGGRGVIDTVKRTLKGVPPCIWVVNEHIEVITVVVSRGRPTRLLTGADLNACPTSAGLSFTTTMYTWPAVKKTLRPGEEATFPLSSRREEYAVITIFKGPAAVLYIENDRIPTGAVAYFDDSPDLRVVRFEKPAVRND